MRSSRTMRLDQQRQRLSDRRASRATCGPRQRRGSRRRRTSMTASRRRSDRPRPSAWRSCDRSCLQTRSAVGAMMGMADGDRQRVGGVGGGLDAGQQRPTIIATWRLSAWPRRSPTFLTRLAAYSNTGRPARAGASSATPRAGPSFRVDPGLMLTKVSSTAASVGPLRLDHRGEAVEQARAGVRPACRSVRAWTTPCATWRSRLPSTSITPQPVIRRPGSRPISASHSPARSRAVTRSTSPERRPTPRNWRRRSGRRRCRRARR